MPGYKGASKSEIYRDLNIIRKEAYIENARGITLTDSRWRDLMVRFVEYTLETIRKHVVLRVNRISQDQANDMIPSCRNCYHWKRHTMRGLVSKWGECTNPRMAREALSFNPYLVPPEELNEKVLAEKRWRAASSGCQYGTRNTRIRI